MLSFKKHWMCLGYGFGNKLFHSSYYKLELFVGSHLEEENYISITSECSIIMWSYLFIYLFVLVLGRTLSVTATFVGSFLYDRWMNMLHWFSVGKRKLTYWERNWLSRCKFSNTKSTYTAVVTKPDLCNGKLVTPARFTSNDRRLGEDKPHFIPQMNRTETASVILNTGAKSLITGAIVSTNDPQERGVCTRGQQWYLKN